MGTRIKSGKTSAVAIPYSIDADSLNSSDCLRGSKFIGMIDCYRDIMNGPSIATCSLFIITLIEH